ncbi:MULTISPECIES: glycosyltransferase family 2 protein [unclassified Providencia]|uniref:glycosyltransferase family 2 protein n=1 Tax=unclassified Providencia TaxID=2633465 RepID=UPI00234A4A73|nr:MULTISPECIES: glycosyltransferase family 2 protein [unclassified Providencia]
MDNPLITVFTPTYNRKENLINCYQSLKNQSCYNFVWQVIDDGSTDDTEQFVSTLIDKSPFEIEYIRVKNGGKCRAINQSFDITRTELWLCLDSDDVLVSNAIEIIEKNYPSIKNIHNICGFFSLRGKDECTPMQDKSIPCDLMESTQQNIRYKLGIMPEYSHVFKTNIAKKFKYPTINNENYFPLSYVYDQIDKDFVYKIIHRPLMVCEYRKDGLTKNKRKLIARNPIGYMLYKKQLAELAPTRKEQFKAISTYITGCLLARKNPFLINKLKLKILVFLFFPIGLIDYLLRYKLNFDLDFEVKTKKI